MRKLLALLTVFSVLTFWGATITFAQEMEGDSTEIVENSDSTLVETMDSTAVADVSQAAGQEETVVAEEEVEPLHKIVKQKFIEGGAGFMAFVLLTLIIGLAFVIERIIYLNLASTNTDKLLSNIENALQSGGVEAAKEVCRSTRGPVASIFYQGLDRADEGVEMAEKSVMSYGSVQMGLLEKNLTWIQLMISIAPMLGFMGTVIGMIGAFDAIQEAGDISPALVAGGIKVALITTVSGLIVAIILQVFYNYIVSKIDSLVSSMEDSSISLIDILYKNQIKK
ncbi:MAG: MotA/TolQ/ExbB proton channel family protein [Bacteroidales bacterium]|nr:MotA/TolQ/ExbB proton channel family protein [Bacteroidales bacterium]